MTTARPTNPQHWRDLSIKDKWALVTAIVSFMLGFVLLFAGMFLSPVGEIDGSVLTGFGTALLYTAGIFGVTMYFKHGSTDLVNNILDNVGDVIEERIRKSSDDNKLQ